MTGQNGEYLTRDHYNTVVVGSGFGGAVAACRLAQAGIDVAVLERGRRWPSGSFPHRMSRPGSGWWWLHRHGLYDISPVADLVCVRAAGWGGGSLVYANVAMRPGPEVFEQDWPHPYRRPYLDPYYDLAAHMLEVTPVQPDPRTGRLPTKTVAMRQAAERLGDQMPLFAPNLAVRFADDEHHPGTNRFGIAQSPCVGCARCDVGCNIGAKNTLDLNYLALAERHGATAATLTEVTHLGRTTTGYTVHLHQHGDAGLQQRTITADRVILAAGALGSTEILLRSRDQHRTLPDLPSSLGFGYSANGDFLAFGDGTADLVSPGTGPTITSAYGLRTRDGDRFYIEDGGYPNELGLLLNRRPSGFGRTAAGHDAVLLVMGRDRSNGRIHLTRRHRLRVDWDTAADLPLYTAANRVCADVVEALGGRAATTWLWRRLRRPVSVHHLGGCRMAADPTDGVVDLDGQVHHHTGLFVLDGAILPAATGANPSHTITAVAERCIETLIRRTTGNPTWTAPERDDVRSADVPEDLVPFGELPVGPTAPGISFREKMRGRIHLNPPAEPLSADVVLTIVIDDLDGFVADPHHRARAQGKVVVPPLTGPEGSAIERGSLDLLARDGISRRRTMSYRLPFRDIDGRRWELTGRKDVWRQRRFDLWAATTSLRVKMIGPTADADPAAGSIRLTPLGVLLGALSIRATRSRSVVGSVRQVACFLTFFISRLVPPFLPARTTRPQRFGPDEESGRRSD